MGVLAHGAAGPYDEVLLVVPLVAVVLAFVVALRKPKPKAEDDGEASAAPERASDDPT